MGWRVWRLPTGRLCAIREWQRQVLWRGRQSSAGGAVSCTRTAGNLWAGAETGLWRLEAWPSEALSDARPGDSRSALIEGDDGRLLIATHGGIRQLVDGKAEAIRFQATGRQFNPTSLLRDRNGGLWIGTSDRGLLHVHQGRTDRVYAVRRSVRRFHLMRLFEDREGNIWVATHTASTTFAISPSPRFL